MDRSNTSRNLYIVPFAAAATSAAVLLVLFRCLDLFPLGEGSILTGDLYSQYAPLLYRFYDVVTGKQNIFVEIRMAGGIGLYADTINEVLNPFNYILLLFGRDRIYLALGVLLLLYLTAASFTGALFFVKTFPEKGKLILPLAVSYGISSYAAYNYQIIKWLLFPVIFPLLLLLVRRLEQEKKGGFYSLLLGYTILMSIQLGFETCLFLFFGYGFYLMILVTKEERKERSLRFLFYSIVGVLLSFFVLLPEIYMLLHSARQGYSSYLGVMQQHGLDDVFERILNITHPVLTAILLYEGILFFKGRTPGEVKEAGFRARCRAFFAPVSERTLFFLVFSAFLLFTVLLQPANLLWHIGSYRCFPVRYGYMVYLMVTSLALSASAAGKGAGTSEADGVKPGDRNRTNGQNTEMPAGKRAPAGLGAVLLIAAAALFAAAALVLAVLRQDRITQAFATMAISLSCRQETLWTAEILFLLFAASITVIGALYKQKKSKQLYISLTLLTALTSFILFIFQIYPGSNEVRRIDADSFVSMTEELREKSENGEAGPIYKGSAIFAEGEEDPEYPRDAAMVNRDASLTAYLPQLPKAVKETLTKLGYTTYWVATTGEGGTEETEKLLTTPMLLSGEPESYILSSDNTEEIQEEIREIFETEGDSVHALTEDEIEENEADGTVKIVLPDVEEGSTVVLPLVLTEEWIITVNGEKEEPASVFAGLIGIRTKKGVNEICLSYRPVLLTEGILISLLGLLILGAVSFVVRKRQKAAERGDAGKRPAAKIKTENQKGAFRLYFLLWGIGLLVVYVIPAAGLLFFMGQKTLEGNEKTETVAAVTEENTLTLLDTETTKEGVLVEMTGQNLTQLKGVKITADCKETKAFDPDYVNDGITDDTKKRWSSVNDTENCNHWLTVKFPEEETVGIIRITWERCNASHYAIEVSDNGKEFTEAAVFTEMPENTTDEIRLTEPVEARYVRLHVTDVERQEEDYSLYYQNVSVLEMEVYSGILDSFVVKTPVIGSGTDRMLETPVVPDGYSLSFAGADYEALIHEDGTIDDTIADVTAEIGYTLAYGDKTVDLPGMEVTIPASDETGGETGANEDAAGGETETEAYTPETTDAVSPAAALPDAVTAAEWKPLGGTVRVADETEIVIPLEEKETLTASAGLLGADLKEILGSDIKYRTIDAADAADASTIPAGSIVLQLEREDGTLPFSGFSDVSGEEGYCIDLGSDGTFILTAKTIKGLRWAEVTLEEILEEGGGSAPRGLIRDYPAYSVRGFGIDVGRRPISLSFLKELVEALSREKMNTLEVHLNDNQILSLSGETISMEEALSKQSGFRLESDLTNSEGEGITSSDLYYTKEEFRDFISWAAVYGVDVVPEIDTPAHSLSLTRVFPELMLGKDANTADELDLSDSSAIELGKKLWTEYTGDGKTFADAGTVGIGMDEYYGDGEDYVNYFNTIEETIHSLDPDVTVRAWASFDWYGVDYSSVSREVEFQVWQTVWQDPMELYENGYKVINSLSADLYIIPGGGMDRLDTDHLEDEWEPNVFTQDGETFTLPAYSSRMLGAVYMMWNEETGTEVSEEGLYDRFAEPLPVLAGKLWKR